jgi:hypothetical protein
MTPSNLVAVPRGTRDENRLRALPELTGRALGMW